MGIRLPPTPSPFTWVHFNVSPCCCVSNYIFPKACMAWPSLLVFLPLEVTLSEPWHPPPANPLIYLVDVCCLWPDSARIMCDSSRRPLRRGCSADDDLLHAMGFRDCALAAVRFLTERARLDPDSAVVRGIRGLLDDHIAAVRVPDTVAGCTADVDVCSESGNVRRVRRTISSVGGAENRPSMARRRSYGHISRRQRARCRHAAAAATVDLSLPACGTATERVGRTSDRRHRYALRTLQLIPTSSRSTSSSSADDDDFCRNVDETTTSDVAECASLLVDLSQSDERIRNKLTELLQLMDTE